MRVDARKKCWPNALRQGIHAMLVILSPPRGRQNLKTAAGREKERYDHRAHREPYKIGDKVWLHNPIIPKGRV